MDPNEVLLKIRRHLDAAREAQAPEQAAEEYEQAAEAFQALDEWLGRGGFRPEDWRWS